jgi:excisionase family DNA binding protein
MRRRNQTEAGVERAAFVPEDSQGGDRRHRIQFFTIAETAEMLRVSTRTVRRWIDGGKLIAHGFGGVVRIAEPDLRAFLAFHRG